jgi:uncharacterized cupin superfamily protein
MPTSHPLLLRAADIEKSIEPFSHPWNPNSGAFGAVLGHRLGLKQIGVNLGRLPPGHESFCPHSHTVEEEWVYVLSGSGTVLIDGQDYEIGAGDFIGFPAPSVVHQVKNTSKADLVYLMGGSTSEVEVADFPTLNRRMVRKGEKIDIHPLDSAKPFPEHA